MNTRAVLVATMVVLLAHGPEANAQASAAGDAPAVQTWGDSVTLRSNGLSLRLPADGVRWQERDTTLTGFPNISRVLVGSMPDARQVVLQLWPMQWEGATCAELMEGDRSALERARIRVESSERPAWLPRSGGWFQTFLRVTYRPASTRDVVFFIACRDASPSPLMLRVHNVEHLRGRQATDATRTLLWLLGEAADRMPPPVVPPPVVTALPPRPGPANVRFMRGIAYQNARLVTLVGDSGRVAQSEDGGATWVERYRDTTFTLQGVAFATAGIGVAIGRRDVDWRNGIYEARMLRTVDSGRTWERVTLPRRVNPSLTSIAFADSLQGVAVGGGGVMLRTTDAGATWQVVPSGTDRSLVAVRFAGALGWVAGEEVLLRTTDAGARWRLEQKRYNRYRDAAFFDGQQGVLIGNGYVHFTADGGDRWTANVAALLEYTNEARRRGFYTAQFQENAASLDAVAMPAPGVIIGVNMTSGAVARSVDGGNSWRPHDTGSRRGFSAIAFGDARNGLLAGPEGVFRTMDGGETWSNVSASGGQRLAAGALSGRWTMSFGSVSTPSMRCEFDRNATLTISHADTTFSGTISGWQVRCASTTVSQFGNVVTATTTTTTTNRSLNLTVPPNTPVAGSTDRFRTFRLLLEQQGVRARFEASLDAAHMSGLTVVTVHTAELGATDLTVGWSARRN